MVIYPSTGSAMLTTQTYGHGPRDQVLLHGFLGSGRNLSTVARRWVAADATLRCITPDLTGHGTSPPLPPNADLATLAHDVLDLMSAPTSNFARMHATPYAVLGHSLGGRVALNMLALAPHSISSVTVLDISPGRMDTRPEGSVEQVLRVLRAAPAMADSRDGMRQHFLNDGTLTPGLIDWLLMNLQRHDDGVVGWRIDREALAHLAERFRRDDLWPVVEQYGDRITCLRGGDSTYVTDAELQRMHDAGCRVGTIPHAGHFVHVDQLDGLMQQLTFT